MLLRLMRLLLPCLIAAVALATSASAQTTPGPTTVSGVAVDSTGLPLPGATVLLVARADSVITGFAAADAEGRFRLPNVAAGAYELRVSFVGFETSSRVVDVDGAPVDVGRVALRARVSDLGQLEVTGRVPVVVRGDTLVYNAADFEVRAGASVDALLDQMPGVEVDTDGTVRAQGRVVDRVTVDGRDFFGEAPSIATRNLPADAVESVHVFDERPDGEGSQAGRRTLNIELRDDRRDRTFGRAESGGGADVDTDASARYVARASVNRFGSALRLSAISSVNNINEPGLTGREYLGLVGTGDAQPGELIRVDSPALLSAGDLLGYASSWTVGANATYDAAAGTAVQASYVGYAAHLTTESETVRERPSLGTETVVETETASGASADWAHRVEARADRALGESHSLRFVTTLGVQGGDGDSDIARRVEDGPQDIAAASSFRTASERGSARFDAIYTRPFGDQWTFRGEVDATLGLSRWDARAICLTCVGSTGPVRGTDRGVVVRAAATRSVGGTRSLQIRAEQTVDVETQTTDDQAGRSGYRRPYTATAVGAVLSGRTRTLSAGVGADLSLIRRGDYEHGGQLFSFPSAWLHYTIAQNQTLRVAYSVRRDATPVSKLHAVQTLSSPFRTYVGNSDLRDVTSHTATAQYLDADVLTNSTLFIYASVRYIRDAQSLARTVDAVGVTTVAPVNAGDALTVIGSASYERPVARTGLTARATLAGSHRSASEVLNGRLDGYRATQASTDLRVRKRGGALRRSEAGVRASLQSLTYGPDASLRRTEGRLTPYFALSATNGLGTIRTTMEQEFRVGSLGSIVRAALISVEVSSPVAGRVGASVVASDLLNSGLVIEQDLTPGLVEVSQYETLGRRVIFRLTATF